MSDTLLERINSPADLRCLDRALLPQLAAEVRQCVLRTVAKTGGHLSASLGAVEIAVALHYVFDTPEDRIVWDVGHQSYAHKILTGRRERMAGLRQLDGISGFPKRNESEYDTFGTGHSSTSISAALGMALAARQQGSARRCIAVIGDGAMTGGMAFEALNNAGMERDARLLVVLNDNDMSISPPVGALNRHLAQLMSGRFYAAAKSMSNVVRDTVPPPLAELARRLGQGAKGMVTPSTLFENFGFHYIGPIDGHDLDALIPTLENIRSLMAQQSGPQFLHIVTRKGKGYAPAEDDPTSYHGTGAFRLQTQTHSELAPDEVETPPEKSEPAAAPITPAAPKAPTFTDVFGQWLCDMAAQDERLVGITPAMREGSGLVEFHKRFPKRYYDVGIAEQHAVTFAAGLACEGLKPVVAIYSTFMQRAYDQLVHDVALQGLPIVFAVDRAGLVGADGATHAGNYDVAYARCIPGISIACPTDARECRQLLTTAWQQNHPVIVRYPRGSSAGELPLPTLDALPYGRGEVRRQGKRIAILAFGTLLHDALPAAEHLDATLVNMRWVKPLDEALLRQIAETHECLVTLEEAAIMGGAGSAVCEALNAMHITRPVLQLGLPDTFIEQGDPATLRAMQGLDAAGIEAAIRARFCDEKQQ